MTRILILGGSGQIGATLHRRLDQKYLTFITNSQSLELGKKDDFENLQSLIFETKPQLIINCVGIFSGNDGNLEQLFNVNVRTSWYIIRIIQELSAEHRIDYSVLGSSAHREGKKDYFLYSASKAALSNLIEGASLSALDKGLRFNVINLPPVESEMYIKASLPKINRSPITLNQAVDFILSVTVHEFITGSIEYPRNEI